MLQCHTVPTDVELLNRWVAGDGNAGNQLFQRHFDAICGFFETKVDRDVEELVQATFMACVQSIGSFQQKSSFRTFLFSIARHKLFRYYRDKRRNGNRLDFQVTSMAQLCSGPRTQLGKQQDRTHLLQALTSLPLDQQILLELYYWEGLQGNELSEILEIAPGTVRSRLHRARLALRERVAELTRNPQFQTLSVEDLDGWARALREKRQHAG